jgi:Leucine-rich repeat (LRR) protein
MQMGAAKLSACSYSRSTTGKGVLELDLDKADDESTLAALLAATLPPSTFPDSQLRSLTLTHSRLSSAQCRGCAAWLEHLTSCSLHHCHPEGGLTELLSELLPRLPRLRALKLDSCSGVNDGELPSAITELQGLQKLTLKDVRLESLPPGRYLNGG